MSYKILIIDDDEADSKNVRIILEREGINDIFFSFSGRDGLEKAQALQPDLVLIDVVLPDTDGFDICRQLKGLLPAIKVIMTTGHMDAVNAVKARGSGADELIEKVPGFQNLLRTIQDLQAAAESA